MTKPMIDLIGTRSMLALLRTMPPARTALRTRHFTTTEVHESKSMDIDIIQGTRSMAISTGRAQSANVVQRNSYKTKSYESPYFSEKRPLSGADLLVREPGTNVYGGDVAGRFERTLAQDFDELDMRMTRAEEFQRSELLQTGACSVFERKEDGTVVLADSIDFNMLDSHKTTLIDTAVWSDTVNSDPNADLKSWMLAYVTKDSSAIVKTIYMGSEAIALYLAHPKVKDYFTKLGYNVSNLEPTQNDDGTIYYLTFMGAQILEYPEWVVHPVTQDVVPLINDYNVVLVGAGIRASQNYGLVIDPAENFAAAVARFPKTFVENDPGVRWVMLQSSFLNALHQVDGVFCATVDAA